VTIVIKLLIGYAGKMQRFVTLQQEEGFAVSFKGLQVAILVKDKTLYQINIFKTI